MSSFKKAERLNSKKLINQLFDRNNKEVNSFLVYPYRVVKLTIPLQEGGLPEVLISVSKRNFKRAVDRNYIKRLTREAYRKNKISFSEKTLLGFIYLGKELPNFTTVENAMIKLLEKISDK